MWNRIVILVGLVMLSVGIASPVHANGFSAVFSGKSLHLNSAYEWNESNVGIGFEYMLPTDARWRRILFAGGFRDSSNEMSYLGGAGLHRRLLESERLAGLYLDAGINLFLMTRNDVENGRPFPGVLPSLTVGNRYVGMNLTYVPRTAVHEFLDADIVDPGMTGIVFLQFKVSVDRLLPPAD